MLLAVDDIARLGPWLSADLRAIGTSPSPNPQAGDVCFWCCRVLIFFKSTEGVARVAVLSQHAQPGVIAAQDASRTMSCVSVGDLSTARPPMQLVAAMHNHRPGSLRLTLTYAQRRRLRAEANRRRQLRRLGL